MNREVHVRFSEGLAVRFRGATQLYQRGLTMQRLAEGLFEGRGDQQPHQ